MASEPEGRKRWRRRRKEGAGGLERRGTEGGGFKRAAAAAKEGVDRFDTDARLITAVKMLRELLPGDSRFGDPLSTAGELQAQAVGRRLAEATATRPGLLRETGLSALQVWDAVARSRGRAEGLGEVTITFTDLVEFSSWSLEAGDRAALDLLRDVSVAIEPPVIDNGGHVVKRLGDGMMAVFGEPKAALSALLEAKVRLERIEEQGYRPRLRAGVHVGRPQRLGDDYFGVDVNVAARIAEAAQADEVLVSHRVIEALSDGEFDVRKRRFRAKGVPEDVLVYAVSGTRASGS